MSRRIPLKAFCKAMEALTEGTHHHTLTPEHIRAMRYRARKAGRPERYPFLVEEPGTNGWLSDIDQHDDWAVRVGRPTYPKNQESGGSAR